MNPCILIETAKFENIYNVLVLVCLISDQLCGNIYYSIQNIIEMVQ